MESPTVGQLHLRLVLRTHAVPGREEALQKTVDIVLRRTALRYSMMTQGANEKQTDCLGCL